MSDQTKMNPDARLPFGSHDTSMFDQEDESTGGVYITREVHVQTEEAMRIAERVMADQE